MALSERRLEGDPERKRHVEGPMSEYRVDVLDHITRAVVGQCHGPTTAGLCPFADRDGVVGCAGRHIAATSSGPEGWLRWVPRGSHRCPLAWEPVE
jgi:hypothetical protein